MILSLKALLVSAVAFSPATLPAQPVSPAAPADASAGSTDSQPEQAITVTGARHRRDDVIGEVQVLSGSELDAQRRPSLGETLAKLPGVSVAGSGPNAAKPVLRGESGTRVRVLTDGIGSLDVSASSSDHAVAINPLTAESIEVLHGPAALLYGSSAVGGVVNVVDARIPRRQPDGPIHFSGLAGFGSAANEKLLNGEADVALGGHFVGHVDLNWTKSGDLDIGGHVLSKPLREQALASPDPDIRALADLKGTLPNSDGRTFEAAGALGYVDGKLNLGVSVTRHTAFYGVPIRFSLDPSVEAEQTHIDVHQTRYDARAEVPVESGLLAMVKIRGGYSDYRHAEIGADGTAGSQVFSKGGEGRAELVQRDTAGGWGGTSGVQLFDVRQHIEGDEQYLPPSRDQRLGLFTLQHVEHGPLRLEAGVRFEHARLDANANAATANPDLSRRFSTLSLSAGGTYAVARDWKLGLSVARSARAPGVDELFANGPHGGNASFELGDPDLLTEKGVGGELSLDHETGPVDLRATLYASHYSNYIYQAPTGEIHDNLPVYAFHQGRARFVGFEADARMPLANLGGIAWGIEGQADAVRATITDVGPAPLIPPLRLLGALTGKRGKVSGRFEVERDFAQHRTAPLETGTPGFTVINAGLDWQPLAARPDLTLSLAANNIFDVEARRATSLLKDYAPIAGRDLRLTLRVSY